MTHKTQTREYYALMEDYHYKMSAYFNALKNNDEKSADYNLSYATFFYDATQKIKQ
ncbi:MAG: hypothetical protein PHG64_15050 [Paludibacter sp.]|nr:hypothetical protein [Paludibacter sp.]